MANEIQFELGETGRTLYAVVRNAAGQAWNGTAFATYTTTRGDFDLAMPEIGTTGSYGPINLPSSGEGRWWQIYLQAGASPSHADDVKVATGYYTIGSVAGHTPQTGDAYPIVNSGVHGNAAIKGYVDDIGVAGAGLTAIPGIGGGASAEQRKIPSSRVLSVKSRSDGTFGVNGRVRMSAGETLWWAVDLKGTHLKAGDLVDSASAPTITGAQAANLTTPAYGIQDTRINFQCVLSGSALTTDTINVKLTIVPETGEVLIVIVPVTVLS